MSKPKTAFISYKWESDELSSWVQNFAKDLRQNGINALLDKWEVGYGESFIEYMESKIPDADYFLFIVSDGSKKAIESVSNKGGAVKFEVQLAKAQVISGDELKFIPIIYNDIESYPKRLRGTRYANFSDQTKYEENLTDLIRDIRGESSKPPIIGIGELQYDTKTYRLFPAEKGSPIGAMMETIEPYVGFPFYSEESDYKSFWPIRVNEDRTLRFNKILEFIQNKAYRKHIIPIVQTSPDKIKAFKEDLSDYTDDELDEHLYTQLRMVLRDGTNEVSLKLLQSQPELFEHYMKLEKNFWRVKKAMPNIIFKLKLRHDRNVLLKNCSVSITILGDLYDIMLDSTRVISDKVLQNYVPGTKLNIKLGDLDPELDVTLIVWYNYIPLASKFDPQPIHKEFEKTKGIKIHSLSADGVKLKKVEGMIMDKDVYEPYLGCLNINQ